MLDNGFSISKVEVYNWGNFHNYQKFNLRSEDSLPGLFSEAPTSAILGINGSGKSTLIDGIMMTLLPFENSLKLGVTNDVESGSSGGRGVKDYVLGKFAATGLHTDVSHDSAYSRETGCSLFLLSFRHNSSSQKVLNLGRAWWYKNGKIHGTSIYFISHAPLSLMDLTVQGAMPTTPKSFKEEVAAKKNSFEFFETAESYFTSMSVCLGGIRKDDLKLFNRAFYVKSISNIDQFIRENMLMESESPHLSVLLENVRNGKDIASSIETCENKLELAEQILKQLVHLETVSQKQGVIAEEKEMLALYPDWNQLRTYRDEEIAARSQRDECLQKIPILSLSYEDLNTKLENKKAQLSGNDIHLQVELIQKNMGQHSQQIEIFRGQERLALKALQTLRIKVPKKSTDVLKAQGEIRHKQEEIQTRYSDLREMDLVIQKEKRELEARSQVLRDELKHYQDHKTLIPEPLYAIKQQAIRELQIPGHHLMFVGELLQVRPEHQKARRACEAALDPISRNLLCHPDSLEKFTRWLNEFGNQRNITVKRIQSDELVRISSGESYSPQSILGMLDLLEERRNSFYHYLQNWLRSSFDFQIATPQEFKRSPDSKLVTLEGLVRSDRRTMKKLQVTQRFCLGWDPQEKIDQLILDLQQVQKEMNSLKNRQIEWERDQEECALHKETLIRLEPLFQFEYLKAPLLEEQLESLRNQLEDLRSKNKSYDLLKKEIAVLDEEMKTAFEEKTRAEQLLKAAEEKIQLLERHLPAKQKEFSEQGFCRKHFDKHGNLEVIQTYLQKTFERIRSGKTYFDLTSDLNRQSESLSEQSRFCIERVARALQTYERDYADSNLNYRVPASNDEISRFHQDWLAHRNHLLSTELVQARDRFRNFFDKVLVDSVKTTINEFKSQVTEIQRNIASINEVLQLTNYEDLATEKRYLQIMSRPSEDDRVRRFKRKIAEVEGVLAPVIRSQIETSSGPVMDALMSFVEDLQKDSTDRYFVTDVRNHFYFQVHSMRREQGQPDSVVEWFTGSKKDAKSSAQTTQLAYALLASALSYRFKFNDPVGGRNTLRTIILDEFGGKFDNEKPKDVVLLLEKMGFQSILVSPMSKADLLADRMSHLVLVHKVSASHSKVQSRRISSKSEYDRVLSEMAGPTQ